MNENRAKARLCRRCYKGTNRQGSIGVHSRHMEKLRVVCADIGSAKNNRFGWCALDGNGRSPARDGKRLTDLAAHVADCLQQRDPVALGFECPLFVPLRKEETTLTNCRENEGNRAWSAGAGCGSLATGLVQVVWILKKIKENCAEAVPAFLSWSDFENSVAKSEGGLFLWEAFVSGKTKKDNHIEDARAGAEMFREALSNQETKNQITCPSDEEVYSLIGAALLRSGWSSDLQLLSKACLALRSAPQ